MHARVVLGVGKGVLFREMPSVQECPLSRINVAFSIIHTVLVYTGTMQK